MKVRSCVCPCGVRFTTAHPTQRYHDSRCKKRHENAEARGTTPKVGPIGAPYDCAQCGKRCVPGENVVPHASKFCGPEHKKAWHNEHVVKPATRRRARRRRAQQMLERAARGFGPTRIFVGGGCRQCGRNFVGVHIDARYCTERCHKRYMRRLGKRSLAAREYRRRWHHERGRLMGWRDQIPATQVAARDGAVCAICGDPVDMSLEVPHDWAPTTDHILPLTRGGRHELGNVQLAHFICNSAKRDLVDESEILAAVAPFAA